jgi:DNA-binding protein YbaB
LGAKTVEGESGGGLVRCTATGKGDIVALAIEPAILGNLGEADRKMVEDLVLGAVNVALEHARELAREEMAQVTGGAALAPRHVWKLSAMAYAGPIARLVQQLAKLPGIG